ncbi:MAG: hypothetical protein ACKVOO_02470 [Burkholderiaceae bacterium]
MAQPHDWASKVLALVKSGNAAAAIAQIKVAPSVKDLKALHTALLLAKLETRFPGVNAAISDNISALSAPRLHRSP